MCSLTLEEFKDAWDKGDLPEQLKQQTDQMVLKNGRSILVATQSILAITRSYSMRVTHIIYSKKSHSIFVITQSHSILATTLVKRIVTFITFVGIGGPLAQRISYNTKPQHISYNCCWGRWPIGTAY